MAFTDIFKRTGTISKYVPSIFVPSDLSIEKLKDKFKGETPHVEVKFPKELGDIHPFDYNLTEGLYKEFGLVTGIIDKYIDFIVGPGFFVISEDERAQKIIEDFMIDTNFDTLLRRWLKETLIKGTGYLELGGNKAKVPQGMKILNANYMYIKRDDLGNILKYSQFIGKDFNQFKDDKVTEFEPHEVAHLSINRTGDSEYGLGIVYSSVTAVNRLIGNEKEMQTLLRRKANSPIHAKMGTTDGKSLPTPEAVEDFGKKLEWLNNKHEWATDALVDMKVLDFGNVSEQWEWVLKHDLDMLFFTYQVPEVLMGKSVNLATAPVQMDAFERRTQSIQAEMEKVIENDIFSRVLEVNGLDVEVEFEWGQKSDTKKMERLDKVTNLLKIDNISFTFIDMLEKEAVMLLDLDVEELETPEAEREREETRAQPVVPGQNQEAVKLIEQKEDKKDYTLKEWLGFNFSKFLESIDNFLEGYGFDDLVATSKAEIALGRLSKNQVSSLRRVLRDGFVKEQSIRTIAKRILNEVKPKDLFRMVDGKKVLSLSAEHRPIGISRTETTRAGAEGSLLHYKDGKVEKVRFVASLGERTCPICEGLNGDIMTLDEANGIIPVHVMCRCTFIPSGENISPTTKLKVHKDDRRKS